MPNEISNADYIVRYCRPSTISNNRIKSTAFKIRSNENYISVNWMPKEIDIHAGLEQVESALAQKNFCARSNGRFVIFNVGMIKLYVYKLAGINISIRHEFSPNDTTHAGIWATHPDETYDRQEHLTKLERALSRFTLMHPGTVYPVFRDDRNI